MPEQDSNPKRPEVGTRWIWEAGQPHAQETLEVTDVRWNGEEWWVKTRTIQRGPSHMLRAAPGGSTHWNNLSRFWEASTPLDAPDAGGEVPMPEQDRSSGHSDITVRVPAHGIIGYGRLPDPTAEVRLVDVLAALDDEAREALADLVEGIDPGDYVTLRDFARDIVNVLCGGPDA